MPRILEAKLVNDHSFRDRYAVELGVIEQTLHTWLKAHRLGKLSGATANGRPITAEQMEMSRVLAENARLKMEVEILKKATAYFAKDQL